MRTKKKLHGSRGSQVWQLFNQCYHVDNKVFHLSRGAHLICLHQVLKLYWRRGMISRFRILRTVMLIIPGVVFFVVDSHGFCFALWVKKCIFVD
jgi:hypothetical protein